ncbi:hypothetical protein SAMN04488557_1515 [Hyphomicrobium facile]|uniref:Uncharacterized protein n=1 Tax=Hyphomicrobium facile TaxID=51670 RepID=A0A1I7NCB7_9HYPH|nr:hypothetical protein SAMN04488557_1515 [Hyphomicrobium facile]
MGTVKAADRIVKSLNLIRGEASRLDCARAEGKSFEAKMALKMINDECYDLRQFLHELQQKGEFD